MIFLFNIPPMYLKHDYTRYMEGIKEWRKNRKEKKRAEMEILGKTFLFILINRIYCQGILKLIV